MVRIMAGWLSGATASGRWFTVSGRGFGPLVVGLVALPGPKRTRLTGLLTKWQTPIHVKSSSPRSRAAGIETVNIAETILEQLGGRRFIAMTGAKHLADYGDALSFKLPGRFALVSINFVKIRLNAMDLYDLQFGEIRGTSYRVIQELPDIDCGSLQPAFTAVTGLDTHL